MIAVIKWVKDLKLWVILGGVIIALLGVLKYMTLEKTRLEHKIMKIEEAKEIQAINIETDIAQEVNKQHKEITQDEIKYPAKLKPNTTYRL